MPTWRSKQTNVLNGINPLAYMGVQPSTPSNTTFETRPPTPHDFHGFDLGDYWFVPGTINPGGGVAVAPQLWVLVGLTKDPTLTDRAWWVQVATTGAIALTFHEDAGVGVVPALGVVNVFGGANINTFGAGNTITINLDDDVIIPGNLTVQSLAGFGVVQVDNVGHFSASNGTKGQIIIAKGAGIAPAWGNLIGAGGVAIDTTVAGQITITGGGAGGFGGLIGNNIGVTVPPDGANIIHVVGDTLLTTTLGNAGTNTLTVSLTGGLDKQVIGGISLGVPAWKTITSPLASVVITSTATEIQLETAGGAGGGVTGLTGDIAGTAVQDVAHHIKIHGTGTVITTDPTGGGTASQLDVSIKGGIDTGHVAQVPCGVTGLDAVWAQLNSPDGSIAISTDMTTVPKHINLTAVGAGGGAVNFPTNDGSVAHSYAGSVNVYGAGVGPVAENINTKAVTTVNPNDTILVNLNRWIVWPNSNNLATEGGISLGVTGTVLGARFLHNRGNALAGGGSVNTFLGSQAGNMALTTATAINNVGLGAQVLDSITSGHDNFAGGFNSLTALTTGNRNTCAGALAGNALVNVSDSVSIGYASKAYTTSTAVGSTAMFTGGGVDNVAVGMQSLYTANVNAAGNVAIGKNAMQLSIISSNCVAIGNLCMQNTTSSSHVAIGYNALNSQTSSTNNCAVGARAGQTLTSTSNNNTIIGNSALSLATTGSASNVSVGDHAMWQLVANNSFNTSVGAYSLSAITNNASYNIGIGYLSGSAATGASSSNIYMGNIGAVESNTIRIGTDVVYPMVIPVGAAGANQQDKTYLAGVFGRAVGATYLPVYIDNMGKLGTPVLAPGTSFEYFQTTVHNNATGDGSIFRIKFNELTQHYDPSGLITNVGGNATFTAPVAGLYHLGFTLRMGNLNYSPPPPPPVTNCPMYITCTNHDYTLEGIVWNNQSAVNGEQSWQMFIDHYMLLGETATFGISIVWAYGLAPGLTVVQGTVAAPKTWISGYLVK